MLNDNVIKDFIYHIIRDTKKAELSENVKIRINYDIINPLIWGESEKATVKLCGMLVSMKKDENGELYILPEGVL
ncbi:MAG: hypothetical protein JXB50_16910 [Spirochaetes bacterium]|nr:hypothetical protein [Spirochaetota bacterium]